MEGLKTQRLKDLLSVCVSRKVKVSHLVHKVQNGIQAYFYPPCSPSLSLTFLSLPTPTLADPLNIYQLKGIRTFYFWSYQIPNSTLILKSKCNQGDKYKGKQIQEISAKNDNGIDCSFKDQYLINNYYSYGKYMVYTNKHFTTRAKLQSFSMFKYLEPSRRNQI